jgi:hypothetical protein
MISEASDTVKKYTAFLLANFVESLPGKNVTFGRPATK